LFIYVADGFEGMDEYFEDMGEDFEGMDEEVCAACYDGEVVGKCVMCGLPLCDECLWGDICLECLDDELGE
jgi:hypothetical protein